MTNPWLHNLKNTAEVNLKTNDTQQKLVAAYTVKNLSVALYLSKVYSKIYTVEIISGDRKWILS